MFYSSARKIREDIATTYSIWQHIFTCYELESQIFGATQSPLFVAEYYGMLKGLWIELDQYQNLKLKNSKDDITIAKFVEQSWIFKFLLGLNPSIRTQILVKELPWSWWRSPPLNKLSYSLERLPNLGFQILKRLKLA